MKITAIDVYRYSIPMEPFTIATGTMEYAQNMLVKVHTSEGLYGLGECSAFPMIAGETQDTCLVLARDFAKLWIGKPALDIAERLHQLDLFIAGNTTAKSAFDMALFDLASKAKEMPLYEYLGGSYGEPESDITIGIGTPEKMAETAQRYIETFHARKLKIKVGHGAEEDIRRVTAIREAVGGQIMLRVDANQGWNYEEALFALTGMQDLGIEFCEQPMRKNMDHKMPSLRRLSRIPLMADESVFTHHDAARLIREQACDFVNIKLSKAGGIMEALRIHDVCEKAEVSNMLGGMLESRLAISAKVHVALACPNIRFHDLDMCLIGHKEDPVLGGVRYEDLTLKIPQVPGIGADVDEDWLLKCEHFRIK